MCLPRRVIVVSDPVTWLDALVVIMVYLVGSLLHKAICSILAARDTVRELEPETGDGVAPDRQDDGTADPSRAVCSDPAAPSPLDHLEREHVARRRS